MPATRAWVAVGARRHQLSRVRNWNLRQLLCNGASSSSTREGSQLVGEVVPFGEFLVVINPGGCSQHPDQSNGLCAQLGASSAQEVSQQRLPHDDLAGHRLSSSTREGSQQAGLRRQLGRGDRGSSSTQEGRTPVRERDGAASSGLSRQPLRNTDPSAERTCPAPILSVTSATATEKGHLSRTTAAPVEAVNHGQLQHLAAAPQVRPRRHLIG